MTNQSIPTINHFLVYVTLEKLYPDDLKFLESIGESIIKSLGLTVVNKTFHKFDPKGITLVYILSQSHFILHTWPEHKFIHLDLFSCSNIRKEDVKKTMNSIFPNEIKRVFEIKKTLNLTN